MEVHCSSAIPEDFFDEMTPTEAFICHKLHMNYEHDVEIQHSILKLDDGKIKVEFEDHELSIEY